ncbi:MAG: copper resistance protein NlpE N-terminal domain-containing protein [Methylococcaceae bacterium]|nr:copper resistance protein NlpE N-terminal domain-containing protein [Methylococcaceae bacterium]
MKKPFKIVAAILPLFAIGCGTSTVVTAHATESSPSVENIAGTYMGMLPCADCEKIRYRLELKPDGGYTSSTTYIGKSDRAFDESGRFALQQDGIVALDKNDEGMKYFKKHPQGLQMLDINSQEISGTLAGNYILTSVIGDNETPVEGQSKDFLYNLWTQGIDFYARGNEPFWSLDMDFEKRFQFTVLNDLSLNTPPTEGVQAQDARINRYHARTESGELIISANLEPCTDTMSGERFEYTVEVQAKHTSDKAYRNFTGCGDYVPDMRLTNIWVVEQVEGAALQPASFMKGLPTLELSARERRLNGHDGCNRLGGAFSTQRNKISFRQLFSTKMFCPTPESTPDIGALLADKTYDFEFGNNRLYLKKANKVILTLKHVD